MAAKKTRGMDVAAVLGTGLAFLAIVGGHLFEGGHLNQIMQPTAALIVFGGTCAGILVEFSWPQFTRAIAAARDVVNPTKTDGRETLDKIIELSKLARRQGLVAIDREAQKIEDPFMQKALRMVADGIEPRALKTSLTMQVHNLQREEISSSKVYTSAGGYAPTIGVLGAVMGLIHVMGNISDPSKLGAGIAVAFVATLYGVGIANLFLLPMGGKLKAQLSEKVHHMEMIIEGACAIAASENPMIVEQRLSAYLSSKEQAAIEAEELAASGRGVGQSGAAA
jgi:chemotaxis protein MotA